MFATPRQHQTPSSLRTPSCNHDRARFHVTTASKAGMSPRTVWRDFKTGERGIIHECEGHTDGFVDDSNIWRATVTCPFHSITTFPSSNSSIQNDGSLSNKQDQGVLRMASSTLFAANEAAMLVPLRQQIIANATVLFPLVVKGKHNTLFRWGHASPDVLFEIAILATSTNSEAQALAESAESANRCQAILTYGLVTKQSTAATGDMSGTVMGAMESLLSVLCFELGKRKDEAVATIAEGDRVKSLGGYVNGGLFQKVGLATKVVGKKR